MFSKKGHRDVFQISLVLLLSGWLILGSATAALAADDAGTAPRSTGRSEVSAASANSEVDEPPPDPLAGPGAGGATEDSEVDEPPPDPLAGIPGWWQSILSRLGKLLAF